MKWFFTTFIGVSFVFLVLFGTNCLYGYFFPLKYQEEIANACQTCEVDEAVILSVINIESHFDRYAVSAKGAKGLMQIMPSTAESLTTGEFDLFTPADNIMLGACYLKQLCNRFENLETALCAYNAGPTNVAGWLKNKEYSEDGVTLKTIPFKETRNYIEKFRKNYKYYKIKT